MAKRKAVVSDIIYELDNDDIEISSDEESTEPKIKCLESRNITNTTSTTIISEGNCIEIINSTCSSDGTCEILSPPNTQNGGKTSPDLVIVADSSNIKNSEIEHGQTENDIDNTKKINNDCSKSTIFNEDIVIDSPTSNSDLGVVGCENKTPLVTVKFKDKKLASNYKQKIKAFMLKLIKLHDEESLTGSENETDLELDIWPEDLIEEPIQENDQQVEVQDNLFFVETAPHVDEHEEIPKYSQGSKLISNIPEKESTSPACRRKPTCFNCNGAHQLRDCPLPRNSVRIAENRKNKITARAGRYHVEDEQKYGHLIPGRISGQLRHALGLKRHELPRHIYNMRILGYPPGWLEEARISHSGITMFDSTGNAILEPDEEEGEICEPGSKDKYDIKKIFDFPGFNVPPSSRYKEESHLYGLPPMSEQDSKIVMLQKLAPNAMKAYKRKKLSLFPSGVKDTMSQDGQAEMDIDSGDEIAEFPFVPPLPDEAPPPPPPPPPPASPPPDDSQTLTNTSTDTPKEVTTDDQFTQETNTEGSAVEKSTEEVIEVSEVKDISVLSSDWITIDDDDTEKSQFSCGRNSPSLDDLEEKKRLLLNALEDDVISVDLDSSVSETVDVVSIDKEDKVIESNKESTETELTNNEKNTESGKINNEVEVINETKEEISNTDVETINETKEETNVQITETVERTDIVSTKRSSDIDLLNKPGTSLEMDQIKNKDATTDGSDSGISKTPNTKGQVKGTLYGAPVMNIASSYLKLPSDDKFAKNICDVINFENLPNSTGKYKQISNLLKRVKSEVDRIQES